MAIIMRNKSSIFGLIDDLNTLQENIDAEALTRSTNDGDLALLNTTEKTNLVGAINEVFGAAGSAADGTLLAANNLSDLTDVVIARTNLGVYSTSEVDSAISSAQLALGTNYTVADITERDAMVGLDVGDMVFVVDDGDAKWAHYKVGAVDVEGAVTSWVLLSDQDSLENSISAASIKTAYESNLDTNAYVDSDKAKVDLISITTAQDLDDAVYKASLEQDLAVSAPSTNAPSAAAVVAYADAAAQAGGSIPLLETVSVVGSTITLTNAPKEGVSGVMNFGTVRYVDVNGIAYDAPVVATATPNEFTVSTDTADQWDGFSVQIQYLYVAA